MQYFLKGCGYLRAPVGRRGLGNASFAMTAYCGVDPDEKTHPDGRDGDTLTSIWMSTLAFVTSKGRWFYVLWLSGGLQGYFLYGP